MASSSPIHCARSCAQSKTIAAPAAPERGGLEKLVRITRFSRDSTRAASSAFGATIENAPTRSPYNENDLENELAIKQTIPAAANLRTARASASTPAPKP